MANVVGEVVLAISDPMSHPLVVQDLRIMLEPDARALVVVHQAPLPADSLDEPDGRAVADTKVPAGVDADRLLYLDGPDAALGLHLREFGCIEGPLEGGLEAAFEFLLILLIGHLG